MVSLSEKLPYEKITENLKKNDKIAVICCNCCVRFCGSGGVDHMNELASKLKADGYTVTDIIPTAGLCVYDYVRNARVSDGITAVVVSACVAGWTSASRRWTDIKVVPTTETLGLVVGDRRVGNLKLIMPFENYKDLAGHEWQMISGERQKEGKIPVPLPEGH
ncbi:MAG TPA: hypothetical protein VJX93_03025 [Candidatus Methanomethylophilaceae archaeon]|nr:hypothetical protein [Candidatus Methanomethylophilaceae archaeon]